jgi:methionyl-tRNA synthetase
LLREENYFFKLSRYGDRLLEWYADHPGAITPEHRGNEVLGFIRQGLQDFSVSRTSLSWGVPIPWDDRHVTYVWFDALANYITAVGYGSDETSFGKWWPVDYHLIGKDIIRFHCVYWPAMLLSAGIEPPRLGSGWMVARRQREDVEDVGQRRRSARSVDERPRRLPLLRTRRHTVRRRW